MATVRRLCIDVIDDDSVVCDSMRVLLESYGFVARCYDSAADYLANGKSSDSGCLLVDIHMPDMTGVDLVELLRQQSFDAPVIFISGRYDPAMLRRAEKIGPLAIMNKPVDADDLIDALQTVAGDLRSHP